jgi:alkaline phosphatase D
VHFSELSLSKEGPYPLYDFTSSNLSQRPTTWANQYKNSYRLGKAVEERNFGLVEIDWNSPSPKLTLRTITEQGQEALRHEVSLSALTFKAKTAH